VRACCTVRALLLVLLQRSCLLAWQGSAMVPLLPHCCQKRRLSLQHWSRLLRGNETVKPHTICKQGHISAQCCADIGAQLKALLFSQWAG
jgi:hypothetical protein